ncbi:MAG: transglutaminase domain-containing protein, partial [Lachnospiraceae bacterium]|nr:transglutaminase domain-containing protein [Lachnospiraceae bacterium]
MKNTANYDYYFSTMGGIQYDPKTSVVILDDQQYSVEYKLTDIIARELERSGISVEEISFEIATSAASNQKRVSYAEQLQWIMTNGNSVYSWNLDPLGEDEDPIEYFLNHPRKGYCTHYASAATLLLRSVGVPARYVTGYIVTAASFEKQKDGSYEA